MTERAELVEMREVLTELQRLLQAEGLDGQYGYLLRRCFELLSWAGNEPDAAAALKEYLLGIPNAPGTLWDLVIGRDSFEERKRVNERLDQLRERLMALARSL